jgi:WXG100 family type VII secretion target
MAMLHSSADVVRQLGQVFLQFNEQIQQQIEPQIQHATAQLENDWQGVSRQCFEHMYQDWRLAMERVVSMGEHIGRHLQETASRFEQSEQ